MVATRGIGRAGSTRCSAPWPRRGAAGDGSGPAGPDRESEDRSTIGSCIEDAIKLCYSSPSKRYPQGAAWRLPRRSRGPATDSRNTEIRA